MMPGLTTTILGQPAPVVLAAFAPILLPALGAAARGVATAGWARGLAVVAALAAASWAGWLEPVAEALRRVVLG